MRKEIQFFFACLLFSTRIPCSKWTKYSPDHLILSFRYFPLIGFFVGGLGIVIFHFSYFIFNKEIAVIISTCSTILMTGALHEDGLADTCDGFGGGRKKENILKIMKDSCIGTYGVLGLILVLGLKMICLDSLPIVETPIILINAHVMSRFMVCILLFRLDHVTHTESKVTLTRKMSFISLVISGVFGLIPFFLFEDFFFLTLIPLIIATLFLGRFFNRRIGGYTGDCLGATQQICEVLFYLSCLVLWKFI